MLAGNLMWKAGIVVGATEQDLEVVDGLIVLKCSQFFYFPVSFLNLSAPFSHSNPSSLFLFTLSNQALSAFQLLSATQPLCSLTSSQSPLLIQWGISKNTS